MMGFPNAGRTSAAVIARTYAKQFLWTLTPPLYHAIHTGLVDKHKLHNTKSKRIKLDSKVANIEDGNRVPTPFQLLPTKGNDTNYFFLIFGSSAIIGATLYGGLCYIWYLLKSGKISDTTYLQQFIAYRWVSHFGPYLVPLMVEANSHEQCVRQITEYDAYSAQKTAAIAGIEHLTQRRAAVEHIVSKGRKIEVVEVEATSDACQEPQSDENAGGTADEPNFIEKCEDGSVPLLISLFECFLKENDEKQGKTLTQFEMEIRILLDLLCKIPPKNRQLPYDMMLNLVNTQSKFWNSKPILEEYRATVVLKLVENRGNSLNIFKMEGAHQPKDKTEVETNARIAETTDAVSRKQSQHQQTILEYLYQPGTALYPRTIFPLTAALSCGECHDLFRRSIVTIRKQIESFGIDVNDKLSVPPPQTRNSLDLMMKLDYHSITQLIGASATYVLFMFLLQKEKFVSSPLKAILPVTKRFFISLRGLAVLETLYRFQEYAIESDMYYKNTFYMFITSMGMAVSNVVATCYILHTHRYTFVPFLFLRFFRDGLYDTFRDL